MVERSMYNLLLHITETFIQNTLEAFLLLKTHYTALKCLKYDVQLNHI